MGSKPTIILVDLVCDEKEHAILEMIQCFPGNCTCAACRLWGQEWNCTVAPDFTSSIAKHSMVLLEAYRENRERNSFGATCGYLLRTRGAFHFNDVVYRWHIAGKLWLPNVYLTKEMISAILPVLPTQSLIRSQKNIGQNLSLLFKNGFGTEKSYSNHSCVWLDSFRVSHHVSITHAWRDHLSAETFLLGPLRKILISFQSNF